MKNVPDTKLGRMYREHINLILKKDIEGLLDQYTNDAVLISSFLKKPIVYRGREELREHMNGILGIDDLETNIVFWGETENPDTLMITEQITMKAGGSKTKMRFADSWVLRDGKIAIHFAGMVQYPDGSLGGNILDIHKCTVSKIKKGNIKIHIFTSPEEGEMPNSLIVETPNKLVLVDAPLLKPYADKLKKYIESLNKPVEKHFITHAHPDHWFTACVFDIEKTYAIKEMLDELEVLFDLQIQYHTQLHGHLLPKNIQKPKNIIEEGDIEIDGITFSINKAIDMEDNAMMIIGIPHVNILLAQDLIYNQTYMYVATKTQDGQLCIDNWIKYIEDYKKKDYTIIIPGHGEFSDASLFDSTIAYLKDAKKIIASSKTSEEFVKQFKDKYPDYRIPLMLEMSAFMLYQYGKE